MQANTVSPARLREFDCVVYGGSLYAGGILGVKLIAKNPCKKLVVFTVGLADPQNTDYTRILKKNFPPGGTQPLKVFHLRGGIDYKNLSIVHRGMMAMVKKMSIGKRPYEELSDEERAFTDTYGGKVDFTGRLSIGPLVEYVAT